MQGKRIKREERKWEETRNKRKIERQKEKNKREKKRDSDKRNYMCLKRKEGIKISFQVLSPLLWMELYINHVEL